jgi:hypothetical protein
MAEYDDRYVVSNGDQTYTVIKTLESGGSFHDAMRLHEYEPDEPNYTPRITGIVSLRSGEDPVAVIAVLRESDHGEKCDRLFYEYGALYPGYGYYVTTYTGDGDPLPAFRGEPYILPLGEDAEGIACDLWNHLDPDNRVAIAVKLINQRSGGTKIHIINQYKQVS